MKTMTKLSDLLGYQPFIAVGLRGLVFHVANNNGFCSLGSIKFHFSSYFFNFVTALIRPLSPDNDLSLISHGSMKGLSVR